MILVNGFLWIKVVVCFVVCIRLGERVFFKRIVMVLVIFKFFIVKGLLLYVKFNKIFLMWWCRFFLFLVRYRIVIILDVGVILKFDFWVILLVFGFSFVII